MPTKTKVLIGVGIVVLALVTMFVIKLRSKGGFGPPPSARQTGDVSQTACPDPVLQSPVDLTQVTAILYPGQERGGDFKPHGGFRFDNAASNDILVKAAMDAKLTDASRYIERGEVQYMFDFQSDCGYRYRFDHLLDLAPKFAAMADKLPKAKEGDSRTTHLDEPVSVTVGEVIATSIGFRNTKNVSVDLGVYDLRGKDASQTPLTYAVCWFDLLPPGDAAKVKSLPPGDSQSGTTSTLCK